MKEIKRKESKRNKNCYPGNHAQSCRIMRAQPHINQGKSSRRKMRQHASEVHTNCSACVFMSSRLLRSNHSSHCSKYSPKEPDKANPRKAAEARREEKRHHKPVILPPVPLNLAWYHTRITRKYNISI